MDRLANAAVVVIVLVGVVSMGVPVRWRRDVGAAAEARLRPVRPG
jgi:uncharacterized protein YjeT (DUF2065 family)